MEVGAPVAAPADRHSGWLRHGGLAEEIAHNMGTGDYICLTLRGSAPWGFTLRESQGDTYRPLLVSQVSFILSACLLENKLYIT